MGTFSCPLKLSSMNGDKSVEVDALVDTGAFYTQAPSALLEELGVERAGSIEIQFADGRVVRQDTGNVWASINGQNSEHARGVPTVVMFGEDDSLVLLGAYTLEGLHLAVDPVHQRFLPVKLHPACPSVSCAA